MSRVFISHSHEDAASAGLLVAALEQRGLKCWIAPRDVPAGGSYAESILEAISGAACFVLVYSKRSNESKHVLREVERALNFDVNIIPVRLDASEPSKSLDYLLATVHWLSVSEPFRSTIPKVAEQIATTLEQPRPTLSKADAPRPRGAAFTPSPAARSSGNPGAVTVEKLSGFGRGKEQSFVDKAQIVLGTDSTCDVRFDATWDKTISARHLVLEKRGDDWVATDQSRDGSWIDGRRIQQEKIQSGAVIELGKGGPRIRIDVARAASPAGRTEGVPSPGFTRPQSVPAYPQPSAEGGEKLIPAVPPLASAFSSRDKMPRFSPLLIGIAALVVITAIVSVIWVTRRTHSDKEVAANSVTFAKKLGKVTVVSQPEAGTTAEWQPVVDMGEEIFPSLIVAAATMKDSPFDTVNDSPNRLGDKRGVVGIELSNPRANSKVRVEIGDNEIMRPSVYEVELPSIGTYRIYPPGIYRYDVLGKIKQTTPVAITISVSLDGVSLGQKAKTVRIASINDCPFGVVLGGENGRDAVRLDWMFAAYVNENHPISDELRKEALKTGIVSAFMGYQGDSDAVYKQVFAIWYVLQRRGVRYSNITTTPGSSKEVYSQYVRFIDQSINNSQANCVDGSVLFASILRQIGIEPILVLVPGHMFVGFYVDPDGKQADFLETTMIGQLPSASSTPKESKGFGKNPTAIKGMLEPTNDTGTADKDSMEAFVAAIKTARGEYTENFGNASSAQKSSIYQSRTVRKEKANCQALPVAKARDMGVMPIGYQP